MVKETYECDHAFCAKTTDDLKGWYVLNFQSETSSLKLEWHFCSLDHVSETAYCMGGSDRCK